MVKPRQVSNCHKIKKQVIYVNLLSSITFVHRTYYKSDNNNKYSSHSMSTHNVKYKNYAPSPPILVVFPF